MEYNFFKHSLHHCDMSYLKLKKLEEKYTIPLYIYNGGDACENAAEVQRCLGESIQLCYTVKANYFLAETLMNKVGNFEVCTAGELQYCLNNHIPAEKLSYSGVQKADKEMRRALEAGVSRFILDSVSQVESLQKITDRKVQVLLRLSSGNQFGMNVKDIKFIVSNRKLYDRLDFTGLHYYAGTQRQFASQLKDDFVILTNTLDNLENKGVRFKEIQLGGGLGVPLYQSDSIQEYEKAADYLFGFIRELSNYYKITYECGRLITANAGKYVTKVFEKKQIENREILLVQGGSHHLKYHGNIVGQRTPFIDCVEKEGRQGRQDYMICGSLCSTGDILSMKFTHSCIQKGDYMIFYNTGAYSLQEASSFFLLMEMPGILVYNNRDDEPKVLELGWMCHER